MAPGALVVLRQIAARRRAAQESGQAARGEASGQGQEQGRAEGVGNTDADADTYVEEGFRRLVGAEVGMRTGIQGNEGRNGMQGESSNANLK